MSMYNIVQDGRDRYVVCKYMWVVCIHDSTYKLFDRDRAVKGYANSFELGEYRLNNILRIIRNR